MQRIPNPVSDPELFMRVFCDVHTVLSDQGDFGLDDISRAMIATNNVTSQGHIGDEALKRSTRKDRSRDPIYNQSKMYAELFRTLGWIQSLPNASLRYVFSILGDHMAAASNRAPLMKECLLGIAYPNEVLGVKSDQTVRVIGGILLAMDELGSISRDEMIAGPMSIADDTDTKDFSAMIQRIAQCRKKPGALDKWINDIATRRKITRHPTMENYTRIPIGMFAWSGWCTKVRGVLTITDGGRDMAARLRRAPDVRLSHFNGLPDSVKSAFIRLTFFNMLERSGFNVEPVRELINSSGKILAAKGIPYKEEIFFSPFQQLSIETIAKWTPELESNFDKIQKGSKTALFDDIDGVTGPVSREKATLVFELTEQAAAAVSSGADDLLEGIKAILARTKSVSATANKLVEIFGEANRDVFYPLIANLFCIIGFNCRMSRGGQNYERADAIILDKTRSIPIEIKSPGEEREISVKGVRQALENKVVLLSRQNYPTDQETTSLVIGFNSPNDRSEVHELIEDIKKAFNIRIGVIDFRSLALLAAHTVQSGKQLRIADFHKLQGVIRV